MFSLTVVLLLAGLGALLAPDTAIGKALREAMIEAPARLLSQDRLSVLIAVAAFLGLIALLIGAPELVAFVGLADVSLCVDFVALGVVLGSVARLKVVRVAVVELAQRVVGGVARFGSPHARSRARAPAPSRRKRPNADEPEPFGGWGLVAGG